jgi:hypothetical protein
MLIEALTMFVVPVLYSIWQEQKVKKTGILKTDNHEA